MLLMMPVAGQLASHVQPRILMALAMTAVAFGMWVTTALEPETSFRWFAEIRVVQVFALPLLFVPITTVAYSDIRPQDTGQASSLINAQRAQFHQSRLLEHIYPSSPNYQQ
jgi:DHA2 family multidrug resistance protein